MELVPLVEFHKLIPDLRIFERDLPFDIKAFESGVNLFNLFLPINNSITTVEIADY